VRNVAVQSISERLNQECFCITLDRDALCQALEREVGDADFCASFIKTRPHLFSNAPVFLSEANIIGMARIVHAIEAATRLTAYREAVLSWAPDIAQQDFGPRGVFMGYDFHLSAEGPKLIEINTNAGGAFLNALLAKAQRVCCTEVEAALSRSEAHEFETLVLRMFEREWVLQCGMGGPRRIAIVDDAPEDQYLYPEFIDPHCQGARRPGAALCRHPYDGGRTCRSKKTAHALRAFQDGPSRLIRPQSDRVPLLNATSSCSG
jgi:hypothetical protein